VSTLYLIEKRREARLRRFGVGLGLVLAGLVHVALFWGPEVRYRPLLEEAQVRRVLVVQPYRPAPPPPPPPPKPKTPGSGSPSAPKPKPATPKPAAAKTAPPDASVTPPLIPIRKSAAESLSEKAVAPPDRGDTQAQKTDIAHLDTDAAKAVTPPQDAWKKVLSELEAQRESLSSLTGREVASAGAAQAGGRGKGGRGRGGSGGGDGSDFMDPRIRITVVSYPPTPLAQDHPSIIYPDLRFRRRELEAGICRVYYRVWTDAEGKIDRRRLESPQTPADQKLYAPFVDAVTSSVDGWPFAKEKTEFHVDVLFEIE
jgi:hypothetical protein